MNLARYADPVTALIDATELGRRAPIMTTVPDGDACDHIASMLRRGATYGVCVTQWRLRMPIGANYGQDILDEIATRVENGFLRSAEPPAKAKASDNDDGEEIDEFDDVDYGPAWWVEVRG